jgi:predicted phosphodiesterase
LIFGRISVLTVTACFRHLAFTAALLALAGCAVTPSAPPSNLAAWTQMAPNGQVSLRAIVKEGWACPVVTVDQQVQAMQLRAAGNSSQPQAQDKNRAFDPPFAVASCQLDLPAVPQRVLLAGQPLAMPKAQVKRIVLLGDTGCRIKISANGKGDPLQDCSSPEAWPWARIASAAAREKPDLVIHVGDYHYREYCDDPKQCAELIKRGGVVSYGWPGWQADFFAPATPLLAQAPWIFVRGNHENCDRGGEGWMRFLSPSTYQPCTDQRYKTASRSVLGNNFTADAWRLDIDAGLGIVVVDNAGHEDYRHVKDTPQDVEHFRRTLGILRQPGEQNLWLLTHRPLWYDMLGPASQPNALQLVLHDLLPGKVQMVVSGHQHAFQTLNFAEGRPAQVIVGGGGTQLESFDPSSLFFEGQSGRGSKERAQPKELSYNGAPAQSGVLLNRYSFLVLDRDAQGWAGQLLDADGQLITRCRLDDGRKEMACSAPAR